MNSPRLKAIEPQLAGLSKEEMLELAAEITHRAQGASSEPKTIDWERFRGILKHGPDAVEYQRAIRAEWD